MKTLILMMGLPRAGKSTAARNLSAQRQVPIVTQEHNPHALTADEAYVLGRYLADGHTRKDKRKEVGRKGQRYWALILSIGAKKLNIFKTKDLKLKYTIREHSTSTYRASFHSKRLVSLAESLCGVSALNKFIHPDILALPVPLLKAFIDGYVSGDGSQRKEVFRATSISRSLGLPIYQ